MVDAMAGGAPRQSRALPFIHGYTAASPQVPYPTRPTPPAEEPFSFVSDLDPDQFSPAQLPLGAGLRPRQGAIPQPIDLAALLKSQAPEDRQLALSYFSLARSLIESLYPSSQLSQAAMQQALIDLEEENPSTVFQVYARGGEMLGALHGRILEIQPPMGMIDYLAVADGRYAKELLDAAVQSLMDRGVSAVLIETPYPGTGDPSATRILGEARFEMLDFPYVQPALDPGNVPDNSMTLAVRTPEAAAGHPMMASLLADSLRQSWQQWGIDVERDPTAKEALERLEALEVVPTCPLEAEPPVGL